MSMTIVEPEVSIVKTQEPAPVTPKEVAGFLQDGRPNSTLWRIIGTHFQRPIEYKTRAGRGGKMFKYIDARDVHDRLDEVVGPGNWSTKFNVLDVDKGIVECTITIFGVSKADVGYPNSSQDNLEEEPLKSAYSDSLKRAGVAWGIGRFLYS